MGADGFFSWLLQVCLPLLIMGTLFEYKQHLADTGSLFHFVDMCRRVEHSREPSLSRALENFIARTRETKPL